MSIMKKKVVAQLQPQAQSQPQPQPQPQVHKSAKVPMVPIGIRPSATTISQLYYNTDPAFEICDKNAFLVQQYQELKLDRVLLPLTNHKYRDFCKLKFQQYQDRSHGLGQGQVPDTTSMSNTLLPQLHHINITKAYPQKTVIGLISPWIELDNVEDPMVNQFSNAILEHELSIANFYNVHQVVLSPPKNMVMNSSFFAINLQKALLRFPNVNISISLPICEEESEVSDEETEGEGQAKIDSLSTWDMWNSIRIQCDYPTNLSVSLALPKNAIPSYVINRWCIEPVKLVLISSTTFVRNAKGYPVLNKHNQVVLWRLIAKLSPTPPALLVHGITEQEQSEDMIYVNTPFAGSQQQHQQQIFITNLAYTNYLKYIVQLSFEQYPCSALQRVYSDFFNSTTPLASGEPQLLHLQTPLQPLFHDLDNRTYEVFEQDVYKYAQYEKAIEKAFQKCNQTPGEQQQEKIQVLIVGPGRGPLIDCTFKAASRCHILPTQFKITAVEKNSTVIQYLQKNRLEKWINGDVEIVFADARNWNNNAAGASHAVVPDIVISELLGSFGDNELFPECLSAIASALGAQQKHPIFIPSKVTSYIAPAMSPLIHQHLCSIDKRSSFHHPYLIPPNCFQLLSSKASPIWGFDYSAEAATQGGAGFFFNRFNKQSFKCHHKGIMHGILGFFKAELYPSSSIGSTVEPAIILSNHPFAIEPSGLISWLPIWFPLEVPLLLTDDQEVEIVMKRDSAIGKGGRGGVWYEWSCESFVYLMEQNATVGQKNNNTKRNFEGHHNSVFGGTTTQQQQKQDIEYNAAPPPLREYQVRVRTGVTKIHNPNGKHYTIQNI